MTPYLDWNSGCQNKSENGETLEAAAGSKRSVRPQTILDPNLEIAARRLQQLSLFAEPA